MEKYISSSAFWDINFQKLDFQIDSNFIIWRVLEYGGMDDILWLIRYYWFDKIKKEVISVSYFSKPRLSFICNIFNLDKKSFSWYSQRRYQNTVWNY